MEVRNAQPLAMELYQGGAANLTLTPERIREFLAWNESRQRAETTLDRYQTDLMQLYDWLPEDKGVTMDRLQAWKQSLLAHGYAGRTVNSKVSAINSYLAFEGRRELQLMDFEKNAPVDVEITRQEYLQLLCTARRKGNQKLYLLIKVFGTMGLPIQHLSSLTVESLRSGVVETSGGDVKIPDCLRLELEDYVRQKDIKSGSVFLTRTGGPLNRTTVASMIKRLSAAAGIDEEKVTSRSLKKMCQDTRAAFLQDMERLVEQAYEELLVREQQEAGWKQGS